LGPLTEAVPDDLKRELELLARELEELKAVLLRYAARDREDVLARAIGELLPEQQTVLALRYQEGLTTREAAAVLGMAEESICQVEQDAFKNLKQVVDRKTD
jgi:RNA polymerase sigma factor (sigma-70 family)